MISPDVTGSPGSACHTSGAERGVPRLSGALRTAATPLALAAVALLAACAHAPAPTAGAAPARAVPPAARALAAAPTASVAPATAAFTVAPAAAASPAAVPPAAAAGSAAPRAATPPAPPGPPPFAQIIQGADRIDAPLVLWRKDDKVWIEIQTAQFGQPFLLSPKIREGIGQAWVLGGIMGMPVNGVGGAQVVEFQRLHNQIRLRARNTDIAAANPATPEGRAIAAGYSASLLAAAPVASQPHPDRKSVLVEANALFLGDLAGVGLMLQQGLRQGYGLDRANSVITAARGSEQAAILETQLHFYTGAPSQPAANAPPGFPVPVAPRYLPDARSLLVGMHYSLAPLPAVPMPSRAADPRLGLFTTTVLDLADDTLASPRRRLVNRWRLEKTDPTAALSPPVKPITFWIDRNVPDEWRPTVRDAILEWNKAFERIGFRDAIVVQQQPEDAEWDTLDLGRASVRWMLNAEPAFAGFGPSHVDPRSGEILDADIAVEGLATRALRALRSDVLTPGAARAAHGAGGAAADPAAPGALTFASPYALPGVPWLQPDGRPLPLPHVHSAWCAHGTMAAEQTAYAMAVLEARGEILPEGEDAQRFVHAYVREALMHEVGHALGLRHNFRASRIYTEQQLSDPEFTRVHGTSGSVMEYGAVNLPRPGQRGGQPFQGTLGPYDYWAIEYAYATLPPGTAPEAERAELQRIAARSAEPLLAFGTDEDTAGGLDPETLQLDLGSDPVAFAVKRLDIVRDLLRRQETRTLPPDRDYAVLRRAIDFALNDAARATGVLVRQIGGVRTLRDFPGSGRDPLEPVPAAVQRQALDEIVRAVLDADGLALSPALQRRLAPDYLDRADAPGALHPDYAMPQRLLSLQRAVLAYLMSDGLAARLLDTVGKFDHPQQAFALTEVYARLQAGVWSELGSGRPIPAPRRELQRDHLNRVAAAVLRPSPQARADARGPLREQARALLLALDRGAARSADAATRTHLADSAETLRRALVAPLQRQGL